MDYTEQSKGEKAGIGLLPNVTAESQAAKILIDHHLNPDSSMFDLVFSETEISSTSELLYYILVRTPYIDGEASRLGLACASAIYTGMTTDTNNFNNSTYPSTLAMASELIACGVDRDVIIEKVMHSYRENRMRLLGTFLSRGLGSAVNFWSAARPASMIS